MRGLGGGGEGGGRGGVGKNRVRKCVQLGLCCAFVARGDEACFARALHSRLATAAWAASLRLRATYLEVLRRSEAGAAATALCRVCGPDGNKGRCVSDRKALDEGTRAQPGTKRVSARLCRGGGEDVSPVASAPPFLALRHSATNCWEGGTRTPGVMQVNSARRGRPQAE